MQEPRTTRLFWWEPRWSFVPRHIREFQSIYRTRRWLWILSIAACVTVLIAIIANAWAPGLQFNWLGAFAISVAAFNIIFLLCFVATVTIPALHFITEKGFGSWWPPLLHAGFSYLERSQLQSITLTIRDDGKHFLRFRTNRACTRVGLARNVDLDVLLELFGDSLIVRDRRRRAR